VGGALREALERVLRQPVTLSAAGRTDAGVHAWGQVVSFDAAGAPDLDRLVRSLNGVLAPDISVREAGGAPDGFDARFSAQWRHYRYTIVNRPAPDPFRVRTAWHVNRPLDVDLMRLGTDPLVGTHDFSSFCRAGRRGHGAVATMVRRVIAASWHDEGDGVLRFEIKAGAFCHQMVRSIVGTLVDVGTGRTKAGEVRGIMAARQRSAAGSPAPPHGLCLWAVGYPPDTAGGGERFSARDSSKTGAWRAENADRQGRRGPR
jgi:tRNA pseudouridine38-40 synthase